MESFPQEWKEKQVLQGWQLLNHDMLPSVEGGYGKVYKIAKEDTGETAAQHGNQGHVRHEQRAADCAYSGLCHHGQRG